MGHEHILVVDDEPGVREFVSEYLTGQGYAVRDLERALEAFRAVYAPALISVGPGAMNAGPVSSFGLILPFTNPSLASP